ncbi:transglutaminase family protein [Sandaracinobacter neustonicus]|uniref:Transglutaminase family protein n=1 Tax=Sandaracinobacter neustonicus TaxID=1715348 RepID=A0A501XE94_9SPHN|nr:transglutaminase family protein [Sandaracinobacter neustonicus]TPE58647.1 transglutaminase family protein [Sandaracinobacter neustonicus]
MQILVDHITRYSYSEPAVGVVQLLKLTPRNSECQQVVSWRIDVDADGSLVPGTDAYGNFVHTFYADRPVESLTLHVTGHVITTDQSGVLLGLDEPLPPLLYRRPTPLTAITAPIAHFAEGFRRDEPLATLHALMLGVHERIEFATGVTEPQTDADAVLQMGRGVCQDLSQLFIASARHLGIPARYVSGHYAAPDHPEQEAAHGWAEGHVEGLGWVSFDPTHCVSGTPGHVRVAVGLDSCEAAPVRGSRRGGGIESLAVGVHGRQAGAERKKQSAFGQTQA